MKGKVKFFNESKGYGFVVGEDTKEYFVHVTECKNELHTDDEVVFQKKDTEKGIQAIDVRLN